MTASKYKRRRSKTRSARGAAAKAVHGVVDQGQSLNEALSTDHFDDSRDAGLARQLAYGTLRDYWSLDAIATRCISKPLKPKDGDVRALLLIGLYQLRSTRIAPHAAVSATVDCTGEFDKEWARGLINAILRGEQRNPTPVPDAVEEPEAFWNHPGWMIDAIDDAWPDHSTAILEHANAQAPLVLRVNTRVTSVEQTLENFAAAGIDASTDPAAGDALILAEARPVLELPGFETGDVSVQDLSAQLVADVIDVQPGHRVLDACAAPGGKTAHMLERCPELKEVVAVDSVEERLERVHDNLNRLNLGEKATLHVADARHPDQWWDGEAFDRILIDAPCSGTGVMARHPDIKHLRRPSDIKAYTLIQTSILDALWPTLAKGGRLVYATCSILPEENHDRVAEFVNRTSDARISDAGDRFGLVDNVDNALGRQRLPGVHSGDGFYYAIIERI